MWFGGGAGCYASFKAGEKGGKRDRKIQIKKGRRRGWVEEEKDGKVRSKEAKGSEHTHTHTYAGNVREQTPQSS